jgi:hypothetical protein
MSDESPPGPAERVCTYDPLVEFMALFENAQPSSKATDPFEGLTIEEALQKHIVAGIRKNLERRIDEALERYEPLALINEVLLAGMKTVGDLFGAGKMQLPFVLQSAEGRGDRERIHPPCDRRGRRSRYRQEPRGHHPEQQRLSGGQHRHQAADQQHPRPG